MGFSQEKIKLLMQNYAIEELFCFFTSKEKTLYNELLELQKTLNFPAIAPDVGQLLYFFTSLIKPKTIFEFGSGYGHSAFWYLLAKTDNLERVYLTEKREDLIEKFHKLSWPALWREKLDYYQGDTFDRLKEVSDESLDLALVDGQKADYEKFMKAVYPKLSSKGLIIIDNSFWKGSFLQKENLHRQSPKAILELHQWLKHQADYKLCFLPMSDGIFLLHKND